MSATSGISVFDVHHHVGDASGALGLPPEEAPDPEAYAALELAKRLEIMDSGGIDQAAVIPGHGYLRPNGHADTQAVNDQIAAYRDANPDRFPVAIGIVEPRDGDVSLAELERAAGPLGPQLLDAAHIVPDKDEMLGQPIVSNGLLLSKTHHAAFDQNLIGIDADYRMHVSEQLLQQNDGPMLESLKQLNGNRIILPRFRENYPDRDRLSQRFEVFKSAA